MRERKPKISSTQSAGLGRGKAGGIRPSPRNLNVKIYMHPKTISKVMAELGRRTSKKKAVSSKKNGALGGKSLHGHVNVTIKGEHLCENCTLVRPFGGWKVQCKPNGKPKKGK